MTTAVESDIDISALVESEKACECSTYRASTNGPFTGERIDCTKPAEWLYVYKCCSHRGLVCEDHYQKHINRAYLLVQCKACKARGENINELVCAMYRV